MYYFLALIIGFLTSVMVAANGALSDAAGLYLAPVVIHVVGLICICIIQVFKRQSLRPRHKLPFYYFLGGIVGVFTTVFQNMAFAFISVSAIMALGFLGQTLFSLVVDHFGMFQMPKRRFNKAKLIGLFFVTVGIVLMLIF